MFHVFEDSGVVTVIKKEKLQFVPLMNHENESVIWKIPAVCIHNSSACTLQFGRRNLRLAAAIDHETMRQ